MKNILHKHRIVSCIFILVINFVSQIYCQTNYVPYSPAGIIERRSSKSRIDFKLYNDGAFFNGRRSTEGGNEWPRGYGCASLGFVAPCGLWFGCLKQGRWLVSGVNEIYWNTESSTLSANQFVPGTIGDPKAAADTVFGGKGWKYSNDMNYIVYLSSDYDEKGVDQSGNNFPDWPIRWVNGKRTFVGGILDRTKYAPIYTSDQDMFCVYKDTEILSDPEYDPNAGPDSPSLPIGIEVHQYCYTWSHLLRDVLVVCYEIRNKSGVRLDECYACFESALLFDSDLISATVDTNSMSYYAREPQRNLSYQYDPNPFSRMPGGAITPYCGFKILDAPLGRDQKKLGMTVWKYFADDGLKYGTRSDQFRYECLTRSPAIAGPTTILYGIGRGIELNKSERVFGTGPFAIMPGESVKFSVAMFFVDGMKQLLATDDLLQRVYDNDFQLPTPPAQPMVSTQFMEGGILFRWDDAAEKSVDKIIPDSLGKPFMGYRLYRARAEKGPYVMIREWRLGRDSLVHEYLDRGKDRKDSSISGLKNNVEYYYKVTSFDEGSLALSVPEMESQGAVIKAIPSVPASSPDALEDVRIVPNPYVVEHAGQRSIESPKLFFNYLPEECTIRIYTVALELVAEIHHKGGSTAEWDLRTQGGEQVASQLLIAQIRTPQGTTTVKKFAVVLAD